MNPSIKKLSDIAQKTSKTIIGLMSGTSLDGLDIALCEISGIGPSTKVELKNFASVPYDSAFKNRLKAITSVPNVSLQEVTLMHTYLGNYHGELILKCLRKWAVAPSEIDCIASHGQTIFHAPKQQHNQPQMPNATLQIGDGDHIAHKTSILTISDFRQKHTAAGGEGAPMAGFIDEILFTHNTEDRILLNIGGIANFTYLPAKSKDRPSITTDTGPGNTLIDAAVRQLFSKEFDQDGKIAKHGSVNADALAAFKSDPYFQKAIPKTTGPEFFNLHWVDNKLSKAGITNVSNEDFVATLTRLTAETIAESIKSILDDKSHPPLYVSGGGFHNPVLMDWLRKLLPDITISSFEKLGFNPDAKEAVIFAILANEMLSGEGFSIDPASKNKINFGKISFPN